MQTGLIFLEGLPDSDVEWIFSVGEERVLRPTETLIREEEIPPEIYIVLQGLLRVYIGGEYPREIARLSSGEILGEMSLVEEKGASASVEAVERSIVLVISKAKIEGRIVEDVEFGARFFRALAFTVSARLREANRRLSYNQLSSDQGNADELPARRKLSAALTVMKEELQQADKEALGSKGEISEETSTRIQSGFDQFTSLMNETIGDDAPGNDILKEEVGGWVQQELLPYMLITENGERWYSKPRGYAGDYLTIEMIYQNTPKGTGRLGKLLDRCFLNVAPSMAVQNRRALLEDEVNNVLKEKKEGEVTRITSMASGPARELFDVLSKSNGGRNIEATLIDMDADALRFVEDNAREAKFLDRITLVNENLFVLAIGRKEFQVEPQDLVYSIGLIDYFTDKYTLKLIDFAHSLLRPGGKLILGNFHPRNGAKAFMDYVLDWRLIHRTEDDMNRLFEASIFGRPCTDIRFEEQGINLFAECIREE